MFCGGCRNPWGACGCVGVTPVCGLGNMLEFEGLVMGDPLLAAEGAVLAGGGLGGAMVAAAGAAFVEGVEELFEDDDFEGDNFF